MESEKPSSPERAWSSWTLQRIRSVISQFTQLESTVSDFLENPVQPPLMKRMRSFAPNHEISLLEQLDLKPELPLALGILDALAPYFWAGLLIEKHGDDDDSSWWLTGFVTRGEYFEIDLADRLECDAIMVPLETDEVRRTSADSLLTRLPIPMTPPPPETFAYLMTPKAGMSFVLFSAVPPIWSEKFLRKTIDLIHQTIETRP